VTEAIAFKRYSSCAYAAGAVDAVRCILAQEHFDLDAVRDIEVATTAPAMIMEQLAEPHYRDEFTPVNVQFSIARSVLMALYYGDIRGYHYSRENFACAVPFIRRLAPNTRLTHDWHLTLQLLHGIDDGLVGGGSEHSAGMVEFYRAAQEFKRKFGRTQSIQMRDIPKLLALSGPDKEYFLGRFLKGFISRIEVGKTEGPFGDFSKLSWRMASRVAIRLRSGARMEATTIVPPGMAGDPNRKEVVQEKLAYEGSSVIGKGNAEALYQRIMDLEHIPIREVVSSSVGKFEAAGDAYA
jgi:2-methylcitrate dehydratase PrpD